MWNTKVAESKARLLGDARAAGREGQGDRRRRRRRVRHPRLHRGVRRAQTGKEAWRFYTIPAPGEPGGETWKRCPPKTENAFCDPEAWKHGGGSVWVTGSYDPELNLTYWGVGNAGPDWNGEQRPGDNLYTDSVVALDADTGKLKWHYQFTPHDDYDYDSVQVPVLADITWRGGPRKVMVWANRNGNFYVLDRATGKFLIGKPFVKVNWMDGFDERGRPQPDAAAGRASRRGRATRAGRTGTRRRTARAPACSTSPRGKTTRRIFGGTAVEYQEGRNFGGGVNRSFVPMPGAPATPGHPPRPDQQLDRSGGHGAVLALDAGDRRSEMEVPDDRRHRQRHPDDRRRTCCSPAGAKATSRRWTPGTGSLLWKASLGAQIVSGPITYEVDGKQYVTAISGLSLCVFGLRE